VKESIVETEHTPAPHEPNAHSAPPADAAPAMPAAEGAPAAHEAAPAAAHDAAPAMHDAAPAHATPAEPAAHGATNAHTEVPGGHGGGHGGGFPPFEPSTFASQIFWLVITFVVLYLIVSRLALPRVGGILENRRKTIEGDLMAAQKLKDESDAQIAAYEHELAEARAKAQTIANETRERLMAETDAARKALDDQLTARLADAETAIAATRNNAMANVKTIAADAAGAIVEQLAGVKADSAAVEAAVSNALKG